MLLFVLPGQVFEVQVPSSYLPSPDRQLGFFYFLEALICDRLVFVLPGQVFEVQVASPPPVYPPLIDNAATSRCNYRARPHNVCVSRRRTSTHNQTITTHVLQE